MPTSHTPSRRAIQPGSPASVVLAYFDACNSGDADAFRATLAHDVVHYFLMPEHPTVRGREALATHWLKFRRALKPTWRIDRLVADGETVVSEWSCHYAPRGTDRRVMFRGSEWYEVHDGRIAEIRAYYRQDDAHDCELAEFPYGPRGYLVRTP